MSTLSQDERQLLKSRAHHLKPVVLLGAKGLTEAVHQEIERALQAHELLKIRLNAVGKDICETMIQDICAQHEATSIQLVGRVATIYRKHSDPK